MIIDSSVILAILKDEPDADAFIRALRRYPVRPHVCCFLG
jgi:uncharacterized protein with PIN domain